MLSKIIESNKYVIENAKFIQINKKEIEKFANQIKDVNIQNWLYNSPYKLLDENIETIITFLLYFEKFVEKCYMLLYTFLEVI